jgi:uncharacterized protein YecE (DUF72 family)
MRALIGTAGWSLPRAEQACFPGSGSHLERYAAKFPAVEINSSFHRSHRAATWLRWRDSVPADFLFAIKVPKTITHTLRLQGAGELLATFLNEIGSLGEKIGCLLVQLPPSLIFEARVAKEFFRAISKNASAPIACEPRHESWFGEEAEELLAGLKIARVAADPARVPSAALPGGWRGMSYYRLHGSPKMYYSAYDESFIAALAQKMKRDLAAGRKVWAIFDNTTLGAATRNALDLAEAMRER